MYLPEGGIRHPTHLVCLRHWFSQSNDRWKWIKNWQQLLLL